MLSFCIIFLLIGSCKKEIEIQPIKLKISVNRPPKSLQKINKLLAISPLKGNNRIAAASSAKGNCYFVITTIVGYLSLKPGTDEAILYSTAATIEDYFNELVLEQYPTHTDALSAYNEAQQYASNEASLSGLNYEPLGALNDPAEQLCEGDEGFASVIDPCAQKGKIQSIMSNTTISQKNNEAKNWTLATDNEYGYEQKISSINGTSYMDIPVRTDGNTNKFHVDFTWNASQGYTIGDTHTHPAGTAPSPTDVFGMIGNLTTVVNSGIGVDFYKSNVSITVISGVNTYVVMVNDWAALKLEYDKYLKNPAVYNNNFANLMSQTGGSEKALLTILGNSINLFKANSNGEFKPREVGDDGLPTDKYCPTN